MATKKEPNKPKKKMSPNSLKNLEATKFNNLSPERRREIARMGAEATNKILHNRKTFRELVQRIGSMQATKAEQQKILETFPDADPDEITKNLMLIASMFNQGIYRGNVKAASFIRDTAGEKPATTIDGTLTTQKVFVTEKEEKEALAHIAEVIEDDGN